MQMQPSTKLAIPYTGNHLILQVLKFSSLLIVDFDIHKLVLISFYAAVEASEEEDMQARPVYVAAIDLACKILLFITSSTDYGC